MREMADLQQFDVLDPEYLIRPNVFADGQRADWCAADPYGTFLVWSYPMVRAVLEDKDLWAATVEESSLGAVCDGPAVEWSRRITAFTDGEVHRRMRGAIGPAFGSKVVEPIRGQVGEIAERLVTDHASGTHELVEGLCFEFPKRVLGSLLGASVDEMSQVQDAVSMISRLWGYESGRYKADIENALGVLEGLALRLRNDPQGVVARVENLDLDAETRTALIMQTIVAGWESTASQLACVVWTLIGRPGRWEQLRSGEFPIPVVVQECLRFQPTTSGALRFAKTDTTLQDVRVPAGTRLFASFLWASRDRDAYQDPDEWLPGRYNDPDVPAPLVFGGGRHRCLGNALAILEIEEFTRALAEHGPVHGWSLPGHTDWTDHRRPRRPITLDATAVN